MTRDTSYHNRNHNHDYNHNHNNHCLNCGVQTHRVDEVGRKRPLSNEQVLFGDCRICEVLLKESVDNPASSLELFRSWAVIAKNIRSGSGSGSGSSRTINHHHHHHQHCTVEQEQEEDNFQYPSGAIREQIFLSEQCRLFANEIKELWSQKIATDMTLRIGYGGGGSGGADNTCETTTTIEAHWCIVAARCKGLARQILSADHRQSPNNTSLMMAATGSGEPVAIDLSSSSSFSSSSSYSSKLGDHPMLLSTIVERCYGGGLPKESEAEPAWQPGGYYDDENDDGYDYDDVPNLNTMVQDLAKLQTSSTPSTATTTMIVPVPFDVRLVGRNHQTGQDEWSIGVHAPILCAHSCYARSFLTHGWTIPRSSSHDEVDDANAGDDRRHQHRKLLCLDVAQFSKDVIEELVHACYNNALPCRQEEEKEEGPATTRSALYYFFQLYQAASFLGMHAISMLVADSMLTRMGSSCFCFPEIFEFAEYIQSTYLMEQWNKHACQNARFLLQVDNTTLARFLSRQLEVLLMSEGLNLPEEEVLGLLLKWAESSSSSAVLEEEEECEDTKNNKHHLQSLFQHVRLPLVPLGSTAMKEAVERGLVGRETLKVCHRFQADESFRSMAIGTLKCFTPRHNEWNNKWWTNPLLVDLMTKPVDLKLHRTISEETDH